MNVDERTCIYLQEGGVTVKREYKDCRVSTLNGFCGESFEVCESVLICFKQFGW